MAVVFANHALLIEDQYLVPEAQLLNLGIKNMMKIKSNGMPKCVHIGPKEGPQGIRS
jgi:hypothetical protein